MNDNYMLEFAKSNLHDAFELIYDLIYGSFNFSKITDRKILNLSKHIKNELFEENGKFYKLYNNIYKNYIKLYELENDVRKDEEGFNPDEGILSELKELHHDFIREFGELMFFHGVSYGKNLES